MPNKIYTVTQNKYGGKTDKQSATQGKFKKGLKNFDTTVNKTGKINTFNTQNNFKKKVDKA